VIGNYLVIGALLTAGRLGFGYYHISIAAAMFKRTLLKGLMDLVQCGDHFWKSDGCQTQEHCMSNLLRGDSDGHGSSGMRFDSTI
jgi:hypothetical protein